MRDIKFRAWDAGVGKMYDDPYGDEYLTEGTPINDIFKNPYLGHIYMQYTGLKDKNGKEIYEGDIVREYDDVGGDLEEVSISEVKWSTSYKLGWDIPTQQSEHLEVIGNIYENKDLLE